MNREWKPGDVAVVVADSVYVGKRAMFCDDGDDRWGWAVESTDGLTRAFGPKELRPLVVIDPDSAEDINRLRLLYNAATGDHTIGLQPLRKAVREFADPTPRIEEPTGLGAVVEDSSGGRFVLSDPQARHPWSGPYGVPFAWPDIAPVRILSEGIQ